MLMRITACKKKDENLTKMANQLPGYQVLLIFENYSPSLSSTEITHNGALNSLCDSTLTRLVS
jgi:hypothetical protein